jgi:hypothetical protein
VSKPIWVVDVGIELDESFRIALQKSKSNGIVKRGDFKEAVKEAALDWVRKKNQELMIHRRS